MLLLDSTMNFFKRTRSLKLAKPTSTYKGQYLGNVSTNVTKGEKCIDKPMGILWNNYNKTGGKQTVRMKISVDNNGLKVFTQTQGLTHYWCHRISYFCVSKDHPKLFIWIYRHVGKKLKVELRCHTIMMANEKKAKALVEMLTEKVAISLQEYRREKALRHRRRLVHEKAAAHMISQPQGERTKLLTPSKNYKPPPEYSLTQPGLSAISEEKDTSSDESEMCESPYSTIGRWRFSQCKRGDERPPYIRPSERRKPIDSDINMNQLPDTQTVESAFESTILDYSLCTDEELEVKGHSRNYSSDDLDSLSSDDDNSLGGNSLITDGALVEETESDGFHVTTDNEEKDLIVSAIKSNFTNGITNGDAYDSHTDSTVHSETTSNSEQMNDEDTGDYIQVNAGSQQNNGVGSYPLLKENICKCNDASLGKMVAVLKGRENSDADSCAECTELMTKL